MATSHTPTKAQIDEVVALLADTGLDLSLHVLPEVFINWEDHDVLALLPAEIVHASLVYLRQEKTAQDDEESRRDRRPVMCREDRRRQRDARL